MAELPRYQQTGRIFADLPQLDFVNVRESMKRSQTIGASIDRLSSFAAKSAEKYVEQEAEKYAVENPITIDDIRQAQESGISAEELIKASGGGTIWEDTLRKYQGEQLRTQLEVQGSAAMTNILSMVEAGQLSDPNEIKQKFESAIAGFERPLLEINPDSAVAFKKSMGVTASTFYKSALDKLTKDYINDQQVTSQFNIDNQLKIAKEFFKTETDPAKIEATRELLFKRVYEQSRNGGTAFAQKQAETFLKDFDALKLNRFTEIATSPEFASDMTTAVSRISKGDFGTSTPLYNTLSEEDKKKVRQNAVAGWNDIYNAEEADKKNRIRDSEEANKQEIIAMFRLPDNSKEKKAKAEALFTKGAITIDTLKSITDPKSEGDGDITAEAHADADISYGRITNERQLRNTYPSLNNKQVSKLIHSMTDKGVSDAKAKIRTAAGAAADPLVPIDLPTAKRIQSITSMYETNLAEVDANGKYVYDNGQALNKAISDYPKTEKFGIAKTGQKRALDAINKNFPGFNPDVTDVDAYAKTKKLDDAVKTKLVRQLKNYKDNKNITGLSGENLQ